MPTEGKGQTLHPLLNNVRTCVLKAQSSEGAGAYDETMGTSRRSSKQCRRNSVEPATPCVSGTTANVLGTLKMGIGRDGLPRDENAAEGCRRDRMHVWPGWRASIDIVGIRAADGVDRGLRRLGCNLCTA